MSAFQTPAAWKNNIVEENSNSSSAFLPSMRGFKLAFLNMIASLPKHIDELRDLLSDNLLDILMRRGSMILSATAKFTFLVMISFAAIVIKTVDSVGGGGGLHLCSM